MTRDDQTISQSDHDQRHDNGAEFDVFIGTGNNLMLGRRHDMETSDTRQKRAAIRYRAGFHSSTSG
jgi:hypothetical protein